MKRAPRPHESARCPRLWEVEAARDGRLPHAGSEQRARHIAHCVVCHREAEYFDSLNRAVKDLDAQAEDELAVRRLRQRTLAASDAELVRSSVVPSRARSRAAVVLAFASALLCIVSICVWRFRPLAVEARSQTLVQIVDEGGARWSEHTDGDIEYVDLTSGTLRVHVTSAPGGRRVVLRVPDGEIDDLGTVFNVTVEERRTRLVSVDEGRVTIRLADQSPVTVMAGHAWARPADPPVVSVAPSPTEVAPAPILSAPSVRRTSSAHIEPRPSSVQIETQASAEDAAYMRVIELLRSNQPDDARAAAKDYLRRFPNGFRREEMGRVAQ